MKKMILLILLLFLLTFCAHAEYWDDDGRPVVCCDDRPGCQVLQTVMMGSFADFDPEDSLNVRVLSAALPRLAAVTEADFEHFSDYFDVDAEELRAHFYVAVGNCLRSDIIVSPLVDDMDAQNARTVLSLFLDPVGEDAMAQMEAIRENCTPETIAMLAEHAEVPEAFVAFLLEEKPVEQAFTAGIPDL